MANILQFPVARPAVARDLIRPGTKTADVLLFTGIRYERVDEAAAPPPKSPKHKRSGVTRSKRKRA